MPGVPPDAIGLVKKSLKSLFRKSKTETGATDTSLEPEATTSGKPESETGPTDAPQPEISSDYVTGDDGQEPEAARSADGAYEATDPLAEEKSAQPPAIEDTTQSDTLDPPASTGAGEAEPLENDGQESKPPAQAVKQDIVPKPSAPTDVDHEVPEMLATSGPLQDHLHISEESEAEDQSKRDA